jgi:hypothetical protein
MSGLMSAVGRGVSAAGYAAGDMLARQALMEVQSEMDLERTKRLEEFKQMLQAKDDERKVTLADQARTAQASRIDAKAGEMADAQLTPKKGLIEAGITDRSTWTPEMQAAVDQSLGTERTAMKGKLRTEAAIATGDISPKDAAVLSQKDEATIYKAMWEQAKEEGRNARADSRNAAMMEASDKRLAYLFAALEKKGAKGTDGTREALSFLDGSRKEIQSEAQNLRQLYQAQIKDKSKGEIARIDAEYQPKFAEVDRKRAMIEEDYNHVRERVGLPARSAAPKPAPSPAPKPAAAASAYRPPLSAFERK